MKNTKITKDQAVGLMCMESANNMPYRVLNAAGKWAVTEFVSKYAARENIISEWFNKVESVANNCDHDETVVIEMRRTMTKSGNPETFAMNDSHFDWMVQEEECCHACEGTGRSTYDERRPCSVCDGEG